MSPADKILEAIRLGLGHLSGENRAAHLRMHLREVGIEAGHPALVEDGDVRVEVESILTAGEPCVRIDFAHDRSGALLGCRAARRLAAGLLLAAFDAEELAKLPRRPAWRYHPPEVNPETDRGDLEPEEEPEALPFGGKSSGDYAVEGATVDQEGLLREHRLAAVRNACTGLGRVVGELMGKP